MPKTTKTKTTNHNPVQRNSQGQSGPKLTLGYVNLTIKERVVLDRIVEAAELGQAITLSALAERCFKGISKAKRNSWVRNQLRRLVRAGFVDPVAPGLYQATRKAKSASKRAA